MHHAWQILLGLWRLLAPAAVLGSGMIAGGIADLLPRSSVWSPWQC